MNSPPSASVSREARRVFPVNMASAPMYINRFGKVLGRLLTPSRIAVGGDGPGVVRPAGKFNKFRRGRDEIVGSSHPVPMEFEDGNSLAAGVPRKAIRHEYDVRVGGWEDRNCRVFVAR